VEITQELESFGDKLVRRRKIWYNICIRYISVRVFSCYPKLLSSLTVAKAIVFFSG
jgi:hypothetical protein